MQINQIYTNMYTLLLVCFKQGVAVSKEEINGISSGNQVFTQQKDLTNLNKQKCKSGII